MKQLSKDQLKEKDKHWSAVSEGHAELETAISAFNARVAEEWTKVKGAEAKYNEAVAEANEWIDGLRSEAQSYYDERSEKWQEGDAGQSYQEWIDSFEDLDEVDLQDPEDVDVPDDGADRIDEIPDAP